MTELQIKNEIRRNEKGIDALRKALKPLNEKLQVFEMQRRLKSAKYKVGQRVEYRLCGCKTVHFGVVRAINCRRMDPTFLVDRVNADGTCVGFGNEVQVHEIFGASTN